VKGLEEFTKGNSRKSVKKTISMVKTCLFVIFYSRLKGMVLAKMIIKHYFIIAYYITFDKVERTAWV